MSASHAAQSAQYRAVTLRVNDLSALLNVVAVALAREQVSPSDTAVREAYQRAREALMTPTAIFAGQPSDDLAAVIAYGGGRSENIDVPSLCLREVVVTSNTACDPAWLDAISVLCLRPLPCDNPHHKPERPTHGTR